MAGFYSLVAALAQHSSEDDSWGTPEHITAMARYVLGGIDLDPASTYEDNKRVGARTFFTAELDGLKLTWPSQCSVFINPPGGKRGNRSMAELFWERLMGYRDGGHLKHALFLAFNIGALQTTQRHKKSMMSFPICVPRRRIRYVDQTGQERSSPPCASAIAYVPGSVNNLREFRLLFSQIGECR